MMSNHWKTLDQAHVWHPYTRASATRDLPMIVRGEGLHLFDDAGRKYVDAISSWWCCALGHGHPRVVEAIRRQAGELQHSILGNLSHPRAAELAGRLARLMPTPNRHVLFASDGSSAVEQALKIALQYGHNVGRPARRRFACIEGAYHGDTLGAMGVGYLDQFHRPFKPVLAESVAMPFPAGFQVSGFRSQVWEERLESHRAELAAVIVEPLCLGAAGMRMYAPEWLTWLADWCRRNEVLLIVDEIAMGMGRTGRMFAFEHAGIDPDIVCVGKALSAGYLPISATIVRDSIYATFADGTADRTLQHGHTFCGNPIAAAAACATLDVFEQDRIVEKAARAGARLRELVEPMRTLPAVKDVRCLGLIAAVELHPAEGRPRRVRERLLADGILLRPLGDVVYLLPPLTIADAELERLVEALRAAVESTDSAR
jgi:adenosylmethionine-8-amino-7-oxononanoate aminotransferase